MSKARKPRTLFIHLSQGSVKELGMNLYCCGNRKVAEYVLEHSEYDEGEQVVEFREVIRKVKK